MEAQSQSLDRISALPEDTIEKILSHMPIRDAVRTSILSRKWRHSWTNMPMIVFDDDLVNVLSDSEEEIDKYKFFSLIFHILLLHKGPISELSICFTDTERMRGIINEIDPIIHHLSWSKSIKTFVLDVTYFDDYYKLPRSLFSMQGLEHLSLKDCKIDLPLMFNGFNMLKSLVFNDVDITASTLRRILTSCPLLEKFTLIRDKQIELTECEFVELFNCLPSIQVLEISQLDIMHFTVDNIPHKLPVTLPHLRVLVLDVCCFELSSVLCVVNSSSNLEKIKIEICWDNYEECPEQTFNKLLDDKDYTCLNLDHLKELEIISFRDRALWMEFVKLIMAKSPVLKKTRIELNADFFVDEEVKMLRDLVHMPFPRASPTGIPKLVFDDKLVNVSSDKYKLVSAIFHVLLLHKGPILELCIRIARKDIVNEIDQIILHLSLSKNIKKFILDVTYMDDYYKLPCSFFSLHGLEHLSLKHCNFELPLKFNGFSMLKRLVFSRVEITANTLQRFLTSCPLLEEFTLIGFHQTNFTQGNKFTFVELFKCLPSVQFVKISRTYTMHLAAGGMSQKLSTSLVYLKIIALDVCFYNQDDISSTLFVINSSPNLEKIKIKMNRLIGHTLTTLLDPQDYSGLNLDHLKEMEIINFHNHALEMEFVKLIMSKSPMLKKAQIELGTSVSVDDEVLMLRDLVHMPFPRFAIKSGTKERNKKGQPCPAKKKPKMREEGGGDVFDHNSPYYIHASDYPRQMHVNDVLIDVNHIDWSQEMQNFLFAKNKFGFIDGSIKKSASNSKDYMSWMRCDAMIKGWLNIAMEKEIRTSVKYATTAQEIWEDLKERFGKGIASRAYELKQSLSTTKQEGMSVSAYYTKLRGLWDKIQSAFPIYVCNCNGCTYGIGKKLGEQKDTEKLYEFLLGLDAEFGTIKTQILAMQPTPSLRTAYHMVADDEQQRAVSNAKRTTTEATAFQAFVPGKRDKKQPSKYERKD
ncbi:hypothetical protein LXL04_011161 [Taraxacum kok-saghyz]